MTSFKLHIVLVFLVGLILSSCRKVGCKDVNSLNYDSEASKSEDLCLYAYMTSIQINQLPAFPVGDIFENGWDKRELDITKFPNQEFPDIQIRITRSNTTGPFFSVNTYTSKVFTDNQSYPLSVSLQPAQDEFIELDAFYTITIVDIDNDGTDGIVSDIFKFSDAIDNKLIIKKGSDTDVIINFEVK